MPQNKKLKEAVELPDISNQSVSEILKLLDSTRRQFVAAVKAIAIANKLKDNDAKRKYRSMIFTNLNMIRAALNKMERKIAEMAQEEDF